MTRAPFCFLTWCFLVLPSGATTPAWVDHVSNDELRRQAQQREQDGGWLAAAELYAELAKREPNQAAKWLAKQLTCRRQDRISRRYYSPHVRQQLLTLRLEEVLGLYEEILGKVHHHAVEEISAEQYFHHGFANFELALRNPAYRAVLFPQAIREDALADYLVGLRQQYQNLPLPNRKQAIREVRTLALNLEQDWGANPTAVVLEFAYASAEAVDEYTEYLPPELVQLMHRAERADVASVGLGFYVLQGLLWVSSVQADSPAAQAGLTQNDLILAIDGIPTQAMTLEEAEWRLLGIEGTPVTLEVTSQVGEASRQIKLSRQKLPTRSVSGKILDAKVGIGLIHIGWFQDSTPEEFDQVYAKLQGQGIRGIILDLRGNPGGLLHAALQVADRFIPEGILTTTRGRSPGASMVYRAQDQQQIPLPTVVLVDPETASAAEVLAGALRDHRRGFLVGQKTFGKGCMQVVFSLRPGLGAVRITTAKWHTPTDLHIGGKGLLPDLLVEENADNTADAQQPTDLSQRQLQAALQKVRLLAAAP
jgi:carboxyl-terminal processing protease